MKLVAFVDKDQPNGVAWCPGYPDALPDISKLFAGPESESLRALLASARFSHTSAEGVPVLVIYATEARLQEVLR